MPLDDVSLRAAMQWVEQCSPLQVFLTAVAEDVVGFVIPVVARESISDAIVAPSSAHPSLSEDSLAFVTWVESGLARRLARDAIFATMSADNAEAFEVFEQRQLSNFVRMGDHPWFGLPSVDANPALWYLRPPASDSVVKRFAFTEYLLPSAVPPQVREFLTVPISTAKRARAAPVLLETRVEAEEAEAMEQLASSSSPSKILANSRIQSAQRPSRPTVPLAPAAEVPLSDRSDPFHTPQASGSRRRPPEVVTIDDAMPPAPAPIPAVAPPLFGITPVPAPAPGPPLSTSSFGSSFGVGPSHTAVDPLAQQLQSSHSQARMDVCHTQEPGWSSTFAPGQPPSQSTFGAPDPLSSHTSYVSFTVDAQGRNVRPKVTAYEKHDPYTWFLDPAQCKAPPAFFFFAALFVRDNRVPFQGQLVSTNAAIPTSWTYVPSPPSLSFCQQFLVPDAKGKDAYSALRNSLDTYQAYCQQSGSFGPSPLLGKEFFVDSSFKAFVTPHRWRSGPVLVVDDLDGTFTALHWVRLHPDALEGRFPSAGFSRDQCIQLLVNVKFLVAIATSVSGIHSLHPCYQSGTLDTIFSAGLDMLLRALEEPSLKLAWQGPDVRLTMLFFDVFERFHLEFVRWVHGYAMSLAFFAEARVASPAGPPTSILLLNPAMSLQTGASTLDQHLREWQLQHVPRLTSLRAGQLILHPSTPILSVLFATASRKAPPVLQVPPTVPFPAPSLPLPSKPAPSVSSSKGEPTRSSVPAQHKSASKPLLQWLDPSKAQSFGRLISDLCRSHPDLKLPRVTIDAGAAGVQEQAVCFAFITAPCPDKQICGCSGWIPKPKSRGRKKCDRAHIDLADSAWSQAPASSLQALWDFVRAPAVAEYLAATDAFRRHME